MRTITRMLAVTVVSATVISATSALATASPVLPANARPHGWTLDRMTGALAVFTASGNQSQFYPSTPFQVLFVKPGDFDDVEVLPGNGFRIVGASTHQVRSGTMFYVPMSNADDSPPFLAPFPTNHSDAVSYFFDPDKIGASGWEITVDGRTVPIGGDYLGGPASTPALPDGGGTHMLTLGAFLHPLTPGTHTVRVRGGLFGAGLGGIFILDQFTYTVIVR